ncbi:hypothetical protein Ga0609869_003320 [Rhodovulum iodosum]|uniref:Uncharacterized protein n=1 Tax=Rhodovulum iodosum TaxID=68291 RepID=A0ABV3XX79_9RHOB|nr:hypothetical protein EJA01_03835 [Rhodovulum robiginosum]
MQNFFVFFQASIDLHSASRRIPVITKHNEWELEMDIIGPLMLGTIGFVVAFAYINKRQTEEQLAESRRRRAQGSAKVIPAE